MPIPGSKLSATTVHKHILLLGGPKIGKTRTAGATSPKGRYVIECDPSPEEALMPLRRVTSEFDYDIVRKASARPNDLLRSNHYAWADIMKCCKEAREGVAAGRYKTIILDTFSELANSIEDECAQATFNAQGEPDGRRYWTVYEKRLRHVLNNLFLNPAHVIITSHYLEVGSEDAITSDTGDKGTPKRGKGLVPLLGGKARGTIPSMFTDVIFMDWAQGKRVFTTGPLGVWGPGCRSAEGAEQIEADFEALLDFFARGGNPPKPQAVKSPNPVTPIRKANPVTSNSVTKPITRR